MSRALAALLAVFLCSPALPAAAKGVVKVQQADGSVQTYSNAAIKIVDKKAMTITTADGKGVLTIDRAACSLVDKLQRCLLYSIALTQNGQTKPLDFDQGTLYVNLTADSQQLSYSSQQVPPNGVVLALRTRIGTYISVTGTLDGDAK